MKVIKITFKDLDGGKYKIFTTSHNLLQLMEDKLFNTKIVDAKTGEEIIHKDRILDALKIYPTKPQQNNHS